MLLIYILVNLLTVCNNYTIWGFIILNMSFWINTELKDIIINPKIGNKTLQNKNKLFRKWNNLIIKILPYHFYKSHHLDWKQSCLTLHCTAWLRLDDNLINIWNLTRGNIHFQSPNVMWWLSIVRSPRSTIVYSVFIRPSQLGTSSGPVVTEEYICHKLISSHNWCQ